MNLYLRLLLMKLKARKGGALNMWDTARTPFRVTPTDLDLIGHVNNGKYLTIMDLGRMDLMLRSGFWQDVMDQGWYPVVAGQTITYRRSLKLGQGFDLYTRVLGLNDQWIFMEQTFCVGEDLYAQAVVRARFLKRSGGSVSHDEILEITGPNPDDRQLPEWVSEWTAAGKPARTYSA